jgi:hypothetical protein
LLLYCLNSLARNTIAPIRIRPNGIPIPRPRPRAKALGFDGLEVEVEVPVEELEVVGVNPLVIIALLVRVVEELEEVDVCN